MCHISLLFCKPYNFFSFTPYWILHIAHCAEYILLCFLKNISFCFTRWLNYWKFILTLKKRGFGHCEGGSCSGLAAVVRHESLFTMDIHLGNIHSSISLWICRQTQPPAVASCLGVLHVQSISYPKSQGKHVQVGVPSSVALSPCFFRISDSSSAVSVSLNSDL